MATIKQPTILIKSREPAVDDVSSPKRAAKEKESETSSSLNGIPSSTSSDVYLTSLCPPMLKSVKFLEDGVLQTEVQEFVQDSSDFLVIGVIGTQGVGKSAIANLLAHSTVTSQLKDVLLGNQRGKNENLSEILKSAEIFKVTKTEDIENNRNTTSGIDIFITNNRVILLDCQPLISMSIIDDLVENENKRSSLVSEFIPSENSGEIQALQLTAFLMSVCHVLLLVQDWFLDSNVVRFIQTAEMLKPTMTNPEDDIPDHFPHLVLVHNKAEVQDFSPIRFKTMQRMYKSLFRKSKLTVQSNIGIGSGRIIKHLNPSNCGSPVNLYLIPDYDTESIFSFQGHQLIEEVIKKLKGSILGATKQPLTHVQLTEKTWLVFCSKAWDNVKKSSFFVEYTKLMP